MTVRMTRDWEDLGVLFRAGEIHHLSDYRQIPESDFWQIGAFCEEGKMGRVIAMFLSRPSYLYIINHTPIVPNTLSQE